MAAASPVAAIVQQLGGVPGRELPTLNALAAKDAEPPRSHLPPMPASSASCSIRLVLGTLERKGQHPAARLPAARLDMTAWESAWRCRFGHQRLARRLSESAPAAHNACASSSIRFERSQALRRLRTRHARGGSSRQRLRLGRSEVGALRPPPISSSLKVLDQQGRGSISNVIAALDYIATNKDAFAIASSTFRSGPVHESFDTDLLTLAAQRSSTRHHRRRGRRQCGKAADGQAGVWQRRRTWECAVWYHRRCVEPHGYGRLQR